MQLCSGPSCQKPPSITSTASELIGSNDQKGVQLYSYWASSCSYRVRIALNLKDIKYEYIAINLKKDEQFNLQYSDSLNFMKQVPSLIIDNVILTQSVPIIEYLEERDKAHGVRLLPNDLNQRSKVRQITEIINSGIQPIQNLSLRKKIISLRTEYEGNKLRDSEELQAEYIAKWCKKSIEDGFDSLEKLLNETAGIYCVGNNVSMADCCLIPQVFNGFKFNVNLDKYPNINRIYINCMHTKPFKDAQPSQQPDAPKLSKL